MLYTGKGDKGTTKLFDSPQGVRVSKSDSIFEALGALDELNSMTGFAKVLSSKNNISLNSKDGESSIFSILENIQNLLFTLQARLAGSDKTIKSENIEYLQNIIADIETNLPPITTFLVPGGTELGAYLDVLRTVARRVERVFVKLVEEGKNDRVSEMDLQFMNRLSSVYYAMARYVNHVSGNDENPPSYA